MEFGCWGGCIVDFSDRSTDAVSKGVPPTADQASTNWSDQASQAPSPKLKRIPIVNQPGALIPHEYRATFVSEGQAFEQVSKECRIALSSVFLATVQQIAATSDASGEVRESLRGSLIGSMPLCKSAIRHLVQIENDLARLLSPDLNSYNAVTKQTVRRDWRDLKDNFGAGVTTADQLLKQIDWFKTVTMVFLSSADEMIRLHHQDKAALEGSTKTIPVGELIDGRVGRIRAASSELVDIWDTLISPIENTLRGNLTYTAGLLGEDD